MDAYQALKTIWKKLGINGQVLNYSSKKLWVLETDTDANKPIARWLGPGFKTPPEVDTDAFKRIDGIALDGHAGWWKFYDVSTAEVFDKGDDLRISAVTKMAVEEKRFGPPSYGRNFGAPLSKSWWMYGETRKRE